ncbi:Jerky protein, partial [Camponotus floridanus]
FFQKFTQLLEEENIIEDNIYSMIDIKFTWKFRLLDEMKRNKNIDTNMKKLKDDSLTIMFCTNATGCHKLLPFCTYTYNDKGALKYLKNIESPFLHKLERTGLDTKKRSGYEVRKLKTKEANDNFVDWYDNCFTKSVRDYQKVRGKVLLLLSQNERFVIPEEIKDNSVEILYIPSRTITTFQPLDQVLRNNIRDKYRYCFPYFCVSGDIEDFIIEIHKPWANLTPVDIQKLWKRLFESDFQTKEDNITEK